MRANTTVVEGFGGLRCKQPPVGQIEGWGGNGVSDGHDGLRIGDGGTQI